MTNDTSGSQQPSRATIIFKSLTALAVFIPIVTVLISGVIEYQQGKRQERDEAFRVIVEDLVAIEDSKRRAAASKLGMFVNGSDQYARVSADLLVSALAFEDDYAVLHAIRGSLARTQNKNEYTRILNALIRLQANIAESAGGQMSNGDNVDTRKLWAQDSSIQNSVTMLMRDRPDFSGGLKFFNNSIGRMLLYELQMPDSELKSVALHNLNLNRTQFDRSTITQTAFYRASASRVSFRDSLIERTIFHYSDLRLADFSGATLREVFFKGSDLAGATFVDASITELTHYHFCGAVNLEQATFKTDPEQNTTYLNQLITQVRESCSVSDFSEYVRSRLLMPPSESALLALPKTDSDGDGTWDEYDLDDDNDGIMDVFDELPLVYN